MWRAAPSPTVSGLADTSGHPRCCCIACDTLSCSRSRPWGATTLMGPQAHHRPRPASSAAVSLPHSLSSRQSLPAHRLPPRRGCGVLSRAQLFATLWTVACQAPLSMGFSSQEYWRGLPFPPSGDLPDSGIEPEPLVSPASQAGPLPLNFPGGSDGKESASNAGDLGSVPASGRSPGGGHGTQLQDPCLENSVDKGAGRVAVPGIT